MPVKRTLSAAAALVIALTMLAGCQSGEREGSVSRPPSATTPTMDRSPISTTSTMAPATLPSAESTEAVTAAEAPSDTEAQTSEETAMTTEEQTTAATVPTSDTDFAVSEMSAKMYVAADVNVRTGPDPSYDRVGHLDKGDEVEVNGVCENGWYRIKFKDGEYFVGGSYLSDKKPEVTTAAATAATSASAAFSAEEKEDEVKRTVWVQTWGTAMLTPTNEAEQIPSSPSLQNNTVRQQIRVSIGGKKLRLTISNEYGTTPLEIEAMTIARLNDPKNSNIDPSTLKSVSYNGSVSFKVPAGERITTDILDFEFDPLSDLAITMKLGSAPAAMSTLTCHTASRCFTWVVSGDHVSDISLSGGQTMTAWYYLCGLDTLAEPGSGAIVCLGDSLTDGASVTTNGFSRYTDELARQLQADSALKNLSVVNMGIGATALYMYGGDIAGTKRANRDVLKAAGVKYCVLLMGVNDIGAASADISQNIINEYKSLIERCHNSGIKIFGCTITPFKGNSYYSDLHEKIRLKVNEFVLSSDSGFDGCIDLASAVASADDSAAMDKKYVSVWNDYLHFNDTGYKFIGKTVYEHIKKYIEKEQ